MKYLFSNAFKNVRRQKKAYLFFSVQILLSFVIMFVFGSVASSLNIGIAEVEQDNTAHSIYLHEIRSDGKRTESRLYYNTTPMTYEDYLWIKENYGNSLSVSFAVSTHFTSLNGTMPIGFNALFVTDEYFFNCYENKEMLDFSKQKIILAPEGAEQLSNLGETGDPITERLRDFLDYAEDEGYTVKPTQSIYNGKADKVNIFTTTWYQNKEQDTEPLSNVMIAPIELYHKYIEGSGDSHSTMLSINFSGETDTVICPLSVFEEYASGQIQLAKLFQTISAVAAVITGVGFIGLILVIFNNRRKKLAIALVSGATYFDLYLEIILEIEAVILSGVLLGEVIGITGLNIMSKQVTVFEFAANTELAVLLPVIYAAMGVVISLTALYNLFKMEPNEVLKKE